MVTSKLYENTETNPKVKSHDLTEVFAIILAAGSGARMADFIRQSFGSNRPKQYVAFTGKRSMLQHTFNRTEKWIPGKNVFVVVDSKHQEEIKNQLADRDPRSIVHQPINRETGPGILLPLARVYKKHPDSIVALFPADHFILEEDYFMEHVRFAKKLVSIFPDKLVLLGAQPDSPEPEYGWIQSGEATLSVNGFKASNIVKFHEKPTLDQARDYFARGDLWNTLVLIGRTGTLWKYTLDCLPSHRVPFQKILEAMDGPREEEVIAEEYQNMEPANFSKEVLQKYPWRLLAIKMKGVFWSDWGNGDRVLETLGKIGRLLGPLQTGNRPLEPLPLQQEVAAASRAEDLITSLSENVGEISVKSV